MKKIENVAKIIADNNAYLGNGNRVLLFVLGVPTQIRGNGNLVVVEFTDTIPNARKIDWGDAVINRLGLTESLHSYGRYYVATKIGDSDVNFKFGSVSIKFRQ